ncbi:MAG: serine--tRNA ligase [Acidobacteria bacterium]|nr:MAG: serine--tRNA ligase [Acidobacteriota bacterium]
MLDLGFVRDNLPLIEEKLRQRGMDPAEVLKDFRVLDTERRRLITVAETLKAKRNRASEEIARLKKEKQDAGAGVLMAETKELRAQGDEAEKQAAQKEEELRDIMARIPNIPHASVPVGTSAEQNAEVRRWGAPPKLDFTPKPHWELGEQLGVLDMERAAKLSGARFAVYWDLGAKLERALANFMLDLHTREHGYTEVLPPYMVNSASMYGTGQLPKFAADLFKCENADLWLVPTAEVPLTNLYRDETIEASRLPLSVTAYTPCFRSEAGSYGKDVRGIIRQHQFQKVELVKFTRPETSYDELEKLTNNAETVLQKLGLHYRVMALCTGDMSPSSAKTYDLEVWLPGQQLFREISSCSNFEAFQARRANIRWRPEGGKKSEFVHTLNGSGLAIGRTWLAIVENYQQADGSVLIPAALQPYMGVERITARKF